MSRSISPQCPYLLYLNIISVWVMNWRRETKLEKAAQLKNFIAGDFCLLIPLIVLASFVDWDVLPLHHELLSNSLHQFCFSMLILHTFVRLVSSRHPIILHANFNPRHNKIVELCICCIRRICVHLWRLIWDLGPEELCWPCVRAAGRPTGPLR